MATRKAFWSSVLMNSIFIIKGYKSIRLGFALTLLSLLLVTGSALARVGAVPAKVWSQLGHSHWIAQGTGTRVLYVIFDPNCPYCHVLIDELQPLIQPMHLQVRYLLVGFLDPGSSEEKAAYILQAKDPLAAILENEKKFNMEHFGGVPEVLPDARSEKILKDNLALLTSIGQKLVPTMIYPEKDGSYQVVQKALGPNSLRDVLKDIPEQGKSLPAQ
ncbi:thioredoxin fold domain-containing protein [Acidithiobacillus sp. AMEEHan]|uniref:thioredoxin fold domain-containing protein n=1 Tax=Acidithiobacillus sp. AMEEHan TaxID=2994951 RepID=UPI0027E56471|nr:thioredoxin fold domain-containing protein [Acidithiobacillus sp. AMEEHan]